MNKCRITYPNNKEVREYLLTLSLCKAKKSRTTKFIKFQDYGKSFFNNFLALH